MWGFRVCVVRSGVQSVSRGLELSDKPKNPGGLVPYGSRRVAGVPTRKP